MERRESWVLQAEEYDRVYADGDGAHRLFAELRKIPLFIGCGFADQDLDQALRLRSRLGGEGRSYAIVPIELLDQRPDLSTDRGLIAIGYHETRHIAELIDEILLCPDLEVSIRTWQRADPVIDVEVGAARVRVPEAAEGEIVHALPPLLADALDPRPQLSHLEKSRRRAPPTHRERLRELLDSGTPTDLRIAQTVISGIGTYPDVLRDTVVRMLERGLSTESQAFNFVRLVAEECHRLTTPSKPPAIDLLVAMMEQPEVSFPVRRGLAKALATTGDHPACRLPVIDRIVGDLFVMRYLVTEGLVAEATGAPRPVGPARPYVLKSVADAQRIVNAIERITQQLWRIPTLDEWSMLLELGPSEKWPWGSSRPERRAHAHLRFDGGAAAPHPIEVGLFPAGASRSGLLDLSATSTSSSARWVYCEKTSSSSEGRSKPPLAVMFPTACTFAIRGPTRAYGSYAPSSFRTSSLGTRVCLCLRLS